MYLILSALCWGPSYLFIKIAVPEIPPLTLVLLRVAIASLILYFVCLWLGYRLLACKQHWKELLVMGITLNALPFFLISQAELSISSSVAGVLNGLNVIFTAIIAHYSSIHEPFTKRKILAILSGIAGLLVIYAPVLLQHGLKSESGTLLMILATLSYGFGIVYARTQLHKIPGIAALTVQLIFSTLLLLPFVVFIDHPFSIAFPSYSAILGVLGLALIGTVLGYYFFYKTIQLAGATYASLTALFVPIIAMILGAFFLRETLSWNLYLGALFIILGTAGVNPSISKTLERK